MKQKNKATWIWYPGDFEVWLGNIFNNRRTERGAMFPPFWKQDSHFVTVEFSKAFSLEKEEEITITCEGEFNFAIDGKLQFHDDTYTIPAGNHKLNLKVWNQATPPALYVQGDTIVTDSTWLATYEDKIWIDENGIAHGSGVYVLAASWCFNNPDMPPSDFHLKEEERQPVSSETITAYGTLYDFGRETFGYLIVKNLAGTVDVYYGESREEALDKEFCETLDKLENDEPWDNIADSKAFRYVYIEKDPDASYDGVAMIYEYAPHDLNRSGSFECSDDLLNKIWEVGAYTMDLTTREFFMDGIKRDRWTWSGDAIQSYLMNYYLHFDTECVKRTIRQLRGKDPVTAHINTIMDYTFYWFKSVLDYYQYTGDAAFICEMWPRMVSLMTYCLGRANAEGMAEGKADDWIFVDWVDFPMHKRGILAFEQILFAKALETMQECAEVLLSHPDTTCRVINEPTLTEDYLRKSANKYESLSKTLNKRIRDIFWDKEEHAYLHAVEDGELNNQITKFPNMFAILYGLSDEDERQQIMEHVMLKPTVNPITTPYMRFYELEALCMMGHQTEVLKEMRDYWGGMLSEGATSFWEKYVPTETGTQHLAMYGRPYGKSLCHAWGASPVYLLGKYFLGVRPTKPGYTEYEVCPSLGGLAWMKGDVPTPFGLIHVEVSTEEICIKSDGGHGTLILDSRRIEIPVGQEIRIHP